MAATRAAVGAARPVAAAVVALSAAVVARLAAAAVERSAVAGEATLSAAAAVDLPVAVAADLLAAAEADLLAAVVADLLAAAEDQSSVVAAARLAEGAGPVTRFPVLWVAAWAPCVCPPISRTNSPAAWAATPVRPAEPPRPATAVSA